MEQGRPRANRRGKRGQGTTRDTITGDDLQRLLIDRVLDYAIFALDADGNVASWNPGAERLKGYRADEIIGKHFSVFYPDSDVRAAKPARELEIATRDGSAEDLGWRVRKDGSRFWADVVITALRNSDGKLIGFAKITRDLTDRRAAEESRQRLESERAARTATERLNAELTQANDQLQAQAVELESQTEEAQALAEELEQTSDQLREALHDAEEANRAKTDFLAVMSHELRTPLNAIAGYAELLRMGVRGPVTAAQTQDLDRILRSERNLLSLINDILNFARIEAGQVAIAAIEFSVSELVTGLETLVLPQLQAKSLVFTCDSRDPALAAYADPEKVRQILLNLLSNAVKFTPTGGTIALAASADRDRVRLTVRDSGIGIPAEKQKAVFEPFVQLNRTLTGDQVGSGLGLAISRDLAIAMGGELLLESVVGKGSNFTLVLPGKPKDAERRTPTEGAKRRREEQTP